MSPETVTLGGKSYVIMSREEYERLAVMAKAAELPPLPEPDAEGNYPAVAYARATISRGIIRDRAKLGLTQRELARRAGIRFETLCRIETGKHSPNVVTVDKIDRALRQAEAEQAGVNRGRAKANQSK